MVLKSHITTLVTTLFVLIGANAIAFKSTHRKVENLLITDSPKLLHYWNFNEESFATPTFTIGHANLTSTFVGAGAWEAASGQAFFGENARNGDETGTHLRFNNPIGSSLTFKLPTTHYENIILKYETRRSGSGAGTQWVSYTINGTDYVQLEAVIAQDGAPVIVTLDFSSISEVDNNPDFGIRVEFEQGAGGTVGNNRFDNVTVEGNEISEINLVHYWNFNDENFTVPAFTTGGATLTSAFVGTGAWEVASGQGFFGENARNEDETGTHLRFDNPIGSSLTFKTPTTGYKDIVFKYETRRSGSGAGTQLVSYTINGADYVHKENVVLQDATPAIITIDFSSIIEVYDNPDFAIRIEFEQGAGGTVGNNRFDNVTVEGEAIPTEGVSLTSPLNGAIDLSLSPLLVWTDEEGSQEYQVQVSTSDDFESLVIDESEIEELSYQLSAVLTRATVYYWRVRSSGADDWSSVYNFTTIPEVPGIVQLLTPQDAAVGVHLKPELSWEAVEYASTYDIQASVDDDFSTTALEITEIASNTYTLNSALNGSTVYYWRVRAVNNGGYGEWSIARSFTTIPYFDGYDLHLNEVMSSNSNTIADGDGDFSDWVEIYNSGDNPVDLTGYGLTDNENSPFKWIFPAAKTIQPGQYLLVWASSDKSPGNPAVYANFGISAGGEKITLTSPGGMRIDQAPAEAMGADISLARIPDVTGNWMLTTIPTPENINTFGGPALTDSVEFSHTAGFHPEEFDLTLTSSDAGATILYTLDGSDPDPANLSGKTYTYKKQYPEKNGDPFGELLTNSYWSYLYTTPIHIYDRSSEANKLTNISTTYHLSNAHYTPNASVHKATVVKARLAKDGFNPGPVTTHTFFIGNENPYNLPIVSISIREDLLFGYENGAYVAGKDFDHWRTINPTIAPSRWSDANYLRDVEQLSYIELFQGSTQVLSQNVGIKLSGNGSLVNPQKSLRLYARSAYGKPTIKYPVFPDLPFTEYTRFTLRNSGNDNRLTMFRDAAIQEVVKHLNFGTQAYAPSIVFINGEYWGIHNMREHQNKDYLASHFGINPDNIDLIDTGEAEEGDLEHFNAVISYLESHYLSNAINYQYINTQIDVEGFTDYQIAEIFSGNTDWPGNNIVYWRERVSYDSSAPKGRDGRWRWLMKDTDFGFGLYEAYTHNTLAFATDSTSSGYANLPKATLILRRLLQNNVYKNYFINRFSDLLNTTFLSDRTVSIIGQMKAKLTPEMPKHIARWKGPANMASWNNYVNVMNTYVTQRPSYQRAHIKGLFELPDEHQITLDVSEAERGYIHINTIDILESTPGVSSTPYPWSGTYFEGIPVTIKAIAKPGYRFVKWDGIPESSESDEILIQLTEDMSLTAVFALDVTRVSPLNASSNIPLIPTFEWIDSGNEGYDIQVSSSEDFATAEINQSVSGSSFSLNQPLKYSSTYYWRIRPAGETYWTLTWHFTTLPISAPIPLLQSTFYLPSIGATVEWNDVEYANFDLLVSTESNPPDTTLYITGLTNKEYTLTELNALSKYNIRVRSVSQGIESNWSDTLFFDPVESVYIPEPLLTVPSDLAVDVAIDSLFEWHSVEGVDNYILEISEVSDFSKILITIDTVDLTISMEDMPLINHNTTYFWRVKTISHGLQSDWSEVFQFTTVPVDVPDLSLQSATYIPFITAKVEWNSVAEASYELLVSTTPDAQDTVLFETDLIDLEYTLTELNADATYYVLVRATIEGIESDWSEALIFNAKESIHIPAPSLILPVHQVTDVAMDSNIKWQSVEGVESYILDISEASDFVNTVLSLDTSGVEITISDFTQIRHSTTYFWRVKATSHGLQSYWSDTLRFTTEIITGLAEDLSPLKVYPNPASESIFITVPEYSGMYSLEIIDAAGQRIKKVDLYKNKEQITLEGYAKGIYVFLIKLDEKNIITKKVLIN